jgi:hypothetical protein
MQQHQTCRIEVIHVDHARDVLMRARQVQSPHGRLTQRSASVESRLKSACGLIQNPQRKWGTGSWDVIFAKKFVRTISRRDCLFEWELTQNMTAEMQRFLCVRFLGGTSRLGAQHLDRVRSTEFLRSMFGVMRCGVRWKYCSDLAMIQLEELCGELLEMKMKMQWFEKPREKS